MANLALEAAPFLGGWREAFDGAELVEVTDLAIVAVAVPLGGREALEAALAAGWGARLPKPGRSAAGAEGLRLLWLAPDQVFALLPRVAGLAERAVAERLGGAGYCVEQTDNWALLRLSGARSEAALERLSPVDVSRDAFPEGAVARTVMEHLGAIVLREGPEAFLLASASSSARSFLHALRQAVRTATGA